MSDFENTLPFMDGMANIYQLYIAMGYIISITGASAHKDENKGYWCGFNMQSRKNNGTPSIVSCIVEGDMAYEFGRLFQKGDQIIVYGEIYAIYDPLMKRSTNRVRVLGWTAFRDIAGINPPLTEDERVFLARCQQLYHEQAPIPSEEKIKEAKAMLNKWQEDKNKGK